MLINNVDIFKAIEKFNPTSNNLHLENPFHDLDFYEMVEDNFSLLSGIIREFESMGPRNHGKEWSDIDKDRFYEYIDRNLSIKEMALYLGRTVDEVVLFAVKNDFSVIKVNEGELYVDSAIEYEELPSLSS